ncbi:ABC transporter substrate-binding protein [Scytonema sp. NUACC26]|uniref:ABC transporter substrate-binding protein n=1 Tax=Scytonema sp. NUACC26 TaxID=3140176 RepID=UPI0034DBBE51
MIDGLRVVIVGFLVFLSVAACSSHIHQLRTHHLHFTSTPIPNITSVRVVKHLMGETQVPEHPQRVIVLHPNLLEAAFALGIKPIAAPKSAVLQLQQLVGKLENIEDVSFESPNLEKLLRLKPDLILGFSSHQNIYPLLSHIAPTVLATFNPIAPWKEFLNVTARALDKTEKAQQLMTNYYARLVQFRASMGQHLQTTVVSVIELRGDRLFLPQEASFSGVILKDAGIARPPNQSLNAQTSIRLGGAAIVFPLSWEQVGEIGGDALFIFTQKDLNPSLQELKTSPLWSKLKIVQLHRIHKVGFYWVGSGPIAANQVIDDLFKYLVNKRGA